MRTRASLLIQPEAVGNWGVLLLAWVIRFRTKEDMNHEKASQT